MSKIKIFLSYFLIVSIVIIGFTGCFRKKEPIQQVEWKDVDLVYYKMFDDEDVMAPLIADYQSNNAGVRIHYKKFEDFEEYMDTIVDELAEGEGPDIFSAQNTWFHDNLKKLTPAPKTSVTSDVFDQAFVDVASRDLVKTDDLGQKNVYGVPLTVDTLALYYNKDHYNDRLPEIGRPAETWAELMDHVYELTEEDDSFERFEVAGIAMGRADNITRAVDVLYLLMLQLGTTFYSTDFSQADFGNDLGAKEALKFFASFSGDENKNYSWNKYISDSDSEEKEITTFAKGKVSMVIGYSYMYEQILDEIKELKSKGIKTVEPSVIRVASIPQMTAEATDKRVTYANYFAETVSRTSENAEEAWKFLLYLGSKEALQKYNEATHKPTSRRDLIEDQKLDPVYGVFVKQIGYAESFPIYNYWKYKDIFTEAIQSAVSGNMEVALKIAEAEITKLLPKINPLDAKLKDPNKNENTAQN
jgi:ABC-type glycerol-3-phosphate transport system substrate-binding protein